MSDLLSLSNPFVAYYKNCISSNSGYSYYSKN